MEVKRKGQIFVMSSIIFASIVLIAVTATQRTSTVENNAEVNSFYISVENGFPEAVEDGLGREFSAESVRMSLYSYNRFVERRSTTKSLDYSASQLVVLPEAEKALILNYRSRLTDYSLRGDSWHNVSLNPYQSSIVDIRGNGFYTYRLPEQDYRISFNATRPRVHSSISIESRGSVFTDRNLR